MDTCKLIEKSYLLCNSIKSYVDEDNNRYFDELWYKDLVQHVRYLKNFTIACPCERTSPPSTALCIDQGSPLAKINFIDLPASKSFIQAIIDIPRTVYLLSKAIHKAEVVHVAISGWPIPYAWVVVPMLRCIKNKFLLIIVESADWRIPKGTHYTFTKKIRAALTEPLNRYCVNRANLAIFTQEGYKNTLMTKNLERGHVINASWVDEKIILSKECAIDDWKDKLSSKAKMFKILFVGRMVEKKGVMVLMNSMRILAQRNFQVQLDMLGQGELLNVCEKTSKSMPQGMEINLLGTVAYSPSFHELIRKYHAIVIPNISDEQPRLVYDAYSQGIPVLASNTSGLRDCVLDGETGVLFQPNNETALANAIESAWSDILSLQTMGVNSLKIAKNMTQWEMHKRRWKFLSKALNKFNHPAAE